MKVPFFQGIFTPYDPSVYGIFWGHIFCQYGGWGWSELFSKTSIQPVLRRRRQSRTTVWKPRFTDPWMKTRTAIYRSLQALRARNPQKVSKSLPGPPGPECPKSLEKSRKVSKKCPKGTFPRLFWDFSALFETFWTLRAGRPGETLWDFLGISGAEGLETPVNGRSGLNPWRQTFFWGKVNSTYRYRMALPEEFISITETDLSGNVCRNLTLRIQILFFEFYRRAHQDYMHS